MKNGLKTILVFLVILAVFFGTEGCKHKGESSNTGDGEVKSPEAPFVEGGASLILSPYKLDIRVEVRTADGSPIAVEGCTETTLPSGTETILNAKGTRVILKGNITELFCQDNQLTSLNVQGLNNLKSLDCSINQLTALDVHGLTALRVLDCGRNQLTELNVQGLTALGALTCGFNKLTELNLQGLTALRYLGCAYNQLTELNVQRCTSLNRLGAGVNRLTELNMQGLTALEVLVCRDNQFTALNLESLISLKELYCSENQLNSDAFKKIFNDLPVRAEGDGAKCVLYVEVADITEGNHTDFTSTDASQELKDAFQNAKTAKHWKMYKCKIGWTNIEI